MKIYFAGDTMSERRQQGWFKLIQNRLLSFFLIKEESEGKLSGRGWSAYKKFKESLK